MSISEWFGFGGLLAVATALTIPASLEALPIIAMAVIVWLGVGAVMITRR